LECSRNKNVLCIPGCLKCIQKILFLCALQISRPIRVACLNVLLMRKTFRVYSKHGNIEQHSRYILRALGLHSIYFSAFQQHSIHSDRTVAIKTVKQCYNALLSFSPSCPLEVPVMFPDSLPRLWHYINHLLTYL